MGCGGVLPTPMYQVRLPSLKGVRSRPLHSWPELASPPLPVLDGSPLGGLMSSSIDGHWPLVVSLRPAALSYSSRRQVSGWRTDSDRVRADGCKLRDRAHPSNISLPLDDDSPWPPSKGRQGHLGRVGPCGWTKSCRLDLQNAPFIISPSRRTST